MRGKDWCHLGATAMLALLMIPLALGALLAGLVALAGLTALALTAPPDPLDRLSSEAAPHLARLPAEEAATRGIDLAKWALSGLHRGIDQAVIENATGHFETDDAMACIAIDVR